MGLTPRQRGRARIIASELATIGPVLPGTVLRRDALWAGQLPLSRRSSAAARALLVVDAFCGWQDRHPDAL